MRLSTMLFGAATLVGVGVYVGKKLIENKDKKEDDDSVIMAESKETYGDKFHKASMYAVGAVKTSADKIAEGVKEIKSSDMVKRGEEAVEQAKEATGQIKKDIEDLKNMVVSINVSVENGEEQQDGDESAENQQASGEGTDVPINEEDFMEMGPSANIDDEI